MSSTLKHLSIALLCLSLILAGCGKSQSTESPTPLPDAVRTAAAQTASAGLTQMAQPTNTPLPTETPLPATPAPENTLALPTFTPIAGATTPAPLPAVTVTPSAAGDRADFAGETIPDGEDFNPGQAFVKTWKLKNGGQTVWTTDFGLAFVGGAQMGGPPVVPLTKNVSPGETVDIAVNLTAPLTSGSHIGYWQMRNAAGALFQIVVCVKIDVIGGTPGAQPTEDTSVRISNLSLVVDKATVSDCPHTFNFTASFELNKIAAVTYRFEAGTELAGFTFDMPAAVTASLSAGEHSVPLLLTITDAVSGWVLFHITAPRDEESNAVAFTLTCK